MTRYRCSKCSHEFEVAHLIPTEERCRICNGVSPAVSAPIILPLSRADIAAQLREGADKMLTFAGSKTEHPSCAIARNMRALASRLEAEPASPMVADKYGPGKATCPFCDGDWILEKHLRDGYGENADDPDAFAYFVRCISCAAQGGWAKSENGAFHLWNLRAGPPLDSLVTPEQAACAVTLWCRTRCAPPAFESCMTADDGRCVGAVIARKLWARAKEGTNETP